MADDIDLHIFAKRTELLYQNGLAANLSVIFVAIVVVSFMYGVINSPMLISWFVTIVSLALIRFGMMSWRNYSIKSRTPNYWIKLYTFPTALIGLCWMWIAIIGYVDDIWLRMVVGMVVIGLVALAVPVLASHLIAFYLYAIPPILATVSMLIIDGGRANLLFAAGIVIYMLAVLRTSLNYHQILISGLRRGFENENLVMQLRLAKEDAESATRSKSKFLNTIVENIPNMIFVKDAKDLRFVSFNKAGEDLLGYSRDDLIGKNDFDFFPKEEADFFIEKDREVLRKGTLLDIPEEPIETKYKGKRVLHTKKIPLLNEKGRPKYLLGISEDITDRKRLEERVQQSQKMEAVGTLTGGIAHDFNNILAAMLGYAELIKQDVSADSQIGQDVEEIITSGRRAVDLVKHLLDYSRKSGMEKQHIHPHLIVKEALKMLRATLPTSIAIEENTDPRCDTVFANPTNIHQVIINLCTNAAHSMVDAKGILRLNLQRQQLATTAIPTGQEIAAGSFVVLTVSDTGCGMDTKTKDRIFEPYFTTKEKGTGTGLGLAVVHGIVQGCKGFIEVESTIGKGSSFHVYLPASEEHDKQQSQEDPKNSIATKGTERILAVDDDPLLGKINKRRLTDKGYHVTCFTDSKEALEKFQTMPDTFDLLITDQTMPGLTGADLAKAVLEIKPSMPIIMCTGHSETVSEEKALSLGIKKYVFKPLQEDELLIAVQEVLHDK